MSKDVIIAGAIAVGCIALIAVAFIAPKSKSPADSEPTRTETTTAPLTDNGGLGGPTSGFDANLPGGVTGPGQFGLPPPRTPGNTTFGNLPPFNGGTTPPAFHQLPGPAPTPVEAPPAPTAESKTHTVASGEFLGDIAMKYYGSAKAWKKIQDANPGLDPKNLKVGQKLVIPAGDTKPVADPGTPATPAAGERNYTIKSGDTLYVIAKRELGSASRWKEIEKLNNVSTSELKVGQVIKLPASVTAILSTPGISVGPDSGTAPAGAKTHTVAKGETLGDISKLYYGTTTKWKKIEVANPGVSSDNLKIGQKLIIPDAGASTTADSTGAPQMTQTGEYTVKSGDTLGSIALSELGSKNRSKELQDANPGLDPKRLRVGQKLKIPGKKTDAVPAPSPLPAPTPFGVRPAPAPAPAPFGAPNSNLNPGGGAPGTAPAPFPGAADNGFNSPYNGNNFGQPVQPFGQNGSSFGQTGTSTLPSSDPFGVPPGQSSPFTPAPPAPSTGAPGQPVR